LAKLIKICGIKEGNGENDAKYTAEKVFALAKDCRVIVVGIF
jgi:hypothetical protein